MRVKNEVLSPDEDVTVVEETSTKKKKKKVKEEIVDLEPPVEEPPSSKKKEKKRKVKEEIASPEPPMEEEVSSKKKKHKVKDEVVSPVKQANETQSSKSDKKSRRVTFSNQDDVRIVPPRENGHSTYEDEEDPQNDPNFLALTRKRLTFDETLNSTFDEEPQFSSTPKPRKRKSFDDNGEAEEQEVEEAPKKKKSKKSSTENGEENGQPIDAQGKKGPTQDEGPKIRKNNRHMDKFRQGLKYEEALVALENPHSGLVKVVERRHISLPPHLAQDAFKTGVDFIIHQKIMKYWSKVQGTIVSIGKVTPASKAYVIDDQPVIHTDVNIEQIVFKPSPDVYCEAYVNLVTNNLVSAMMHDLIPVTIELGKEPGKKIPGKVEVGDRIAVKITGFDTRGSMCKYHAELLDILGKNERPNIRRPRIEVTEDGQEIVKHDKVRLELTKEQLAEKRRNKHLVHEHHLRTEAAKSTVQDPKPANQRKVFKEEDDD